MRLWLIVCAMIAGFWSPAAEARRAALVIGNGAYLNAAGLANPASDAQIVANGARRAGFDVTLLNNLTKESFDQSLREFRRQADGADVAMIYFAGHGLESGGKNWLLPVDVQLKESRDLRFEAIELDGLLETLTGARLRMVILDACRNNAFGNSWQSGTRSSQKGLAEIEIEGALVIYAAAGGQVAADGLGANSPFAASLASRLAEPGLSIHRLGSVVLEDVMAATGGQQRPWTNMSIASREFFLVEPPQAAAPAPAVRAALPVAPALSAAEDRATMDALTWQGAATSNTLEGYRAYLRNFSGGIFANMARERIAALQGPAAAPTAAPQVSPQRSVELASVSTPMAAMPRPATPPPPAPSPAASPDAGGATVSPASSPDPAPLETPVGLTFALRAGAPLPVMPATPRFPAEGYPACRDTFQAIADPIGKVEEINRCMALLSQYFETVLNGFSRTMIEHQKAISQLYTAQVAGSSAFTVEGQDRFYRAMMKEHADSDPGGSNFADHALTRARYEKDRAYLEDRYCFHTGRCGGYAVPAGVAPPAK